MQFTPQPIAGFRKPKPFNDMFNLLQRILDGNVGQDNMGPNSVNGVALAPASVHVNHFDPSIAIPRRYIEGQATRPGDVSLAGNKSEWRPGKADFFCPIDGSVEFAEFRPDHNCRIYFIGQVTAHMLTTSSVNSDELIIYLADGVTVGSATHTGSAGGNVFGSACARFNKDEKRTIHFSCWADCVAGTAYHFKLLGSVQDAGSHWDILSTDANRRSNLTNVVTQILT